MSSKTPEKLAVATALARKRPIGKFVVTIALSLVVVIVVLQYVLRLQLSSQTLMFNDHRIILEVVDDRASRQLGLSGRAGIADDAGMLFVFDAESVQNCFWMKDMNFAIDMLWMDAHKQVVTISEQVGPETYPRSFCPSSDAKYGLEIGAGRASELGIVEGAKLDF